MICGAWWGFHLWYLVLVLDWIKFLSGVENWLFGLWSEDVEPHVLEQIPVIKRRQLIVSKGVFALLICVLIQST